MTDTVASMTNGSSKKTGGKGRRHQPKGEAKGDRHKPRRMVGIQGRFLDAGEHAADRLGMSFAQMVNQALREKLEAMRLWPPADGGAADDESD